ncbi:MAG: 6-aminohexanoate hydrolase [Candidatus Rokuibacteriota bacterium]|nr:MAG: 6-aminohexanoate hydrolase [Candidatus Rokubacteria bacterium]
MVRAAAMLLAVTWLFSSSPACPSPSRAAPAGLWVSDQSFGHPARGPLTITMNGRRGRAEIDGRVAAFEIAGDSIRFALPDSSGSFRGRFERVDRAIRGFWIRPAIVEGLTHASDDRGGLFDQAMATPMWLARIGAGCYRGLVVPLEARFTLYLFIWSDSANAWRAAFRNPQFNATGGASRFRMSIDGDSLRFVASFSDRPERRLAAFWDRAHSRICVRWDGIDAPLTLRPGEPADSAGFWPRTPRGRTFAYHAPSAGNDGWSTARASSVGMDERALARLTEALADTNPVAPRAPLVHSCLVERHGRLVYEEYFFGFDRDQTHDLRSAGKTFASVMLGAAMHAGLPIAPESSVYSLMAGRGPFANPDARKARITVDELMTHTSGLACDDNNDASPGNEDTMQGQTATDDWWKYTLDLPVAFEPGTRYAYCSGGMNLVGGALSAVTGCWIPEYFDSTVARPLEFRRYHFNLMPNDEGYLGGGVQLRPRDLLKLGRAYLDGGVWHGRRIVDSSWVRRSTSPLVEISEATTGLDSSSFSNAYLRGADGFAWHLSELRCGERTYRAYGASGNGGQLLIVVPELDLSVVFTAGNYSNGGIWIRLRDQLVPQRIITAIQGR